MSDLADRVIEWLKTYPSTKRRIELISFELSSCPMISENEIIESMALSAHLEGQGYNHGGHPSDKTMAIALHYKGKMWSIEDDMKREMRQELRALKSDLDRLEHYVSILKKREGDVIRLLYFEQKTWFEAEEELRVSKQTLSRCRKSAIRELVSMFSMVEHIGVADSVDH